VKKTPRGTLLLVASLAFLALAAVTWAVVDWLDPFNDAAFTTEGWAKLDSQDRAPMSRDLIRNHLHPGASRAQIERLLGPPDDVLTGSDSGGNRMRGTDTYAYCIGFWPVRGFDDTFVYVHLDAQGNVVASEINGY